MDSESRSDPVEMMRMQTPKSSRGAGDAGGGDWFGLSEDGGRRARRLLYAREPGEIHVHHGGYCTNKGLGEGWQRRGRRQLEL
ncbi:hypothetical protein PG985_010321 [Apiospora marii]|uniref:Uncharacterized protein n=1 Tax=Apiospora marii TaxID=335849 RepID=A0ABR1RLK4_9PEZI